ILCNRDISDFTFISKILSTNINDINDEKALLDIDLACNTLNIAINAKKNIRIIGDYDVDGVCATFILYDGIRKFTENVSYYIPDRFKDGYGINKNIIDDAIKDKIDLIITCDNGIAANNEIDYANKNGISVIVTDHHDIQELPEKALAIVNPKREDENANYPFKGICGAVVAMKYMMRFYDLYKKELGRNYVLESYLEFATIATISDIMPLIDENHIIVKQGLKKILNTNNKGLKKLLEVSEIDFENRGLTTYHIGFIIGPLINAAGRMEEAKKALALFLSQDDIEINEIALKLKTLNNERKQMTDNGVKLAIKSVEEKFIEDKVLVIYVEGLGEQVAGIVAGRIKDKYNKPTIILTDTVETEVAKASCRSIEAYNIFEALNLHHDMLLKFGGHKLAAGFSILKNDIDTLRRMLNEEAKLEESDFVKKVYIDAEFPFYEMSEDVVNDIEKLEPFGQSFERPKFATKSVKVKILNVYGNNKNIVRLSLEKDNKYAVGVLFEESYILEERLKKSIELDIVYYPKINEYKGNKSIEINVVAYR
ncbi:MAG: single-stranded-DNA-specific exonuclease RecJ, partial [Lachnospiraceae bacterium]|nr:single-stranded-DNA-specific exonuclease RecJ [Lachnospiraceae bacterium]